jgi:hypothetical protein
MSAVWEITEKNFRREGIVAAMSSVYSSKKKSGFSKGVFCFCFCFFFFFFFFFSLFSQKGQAQRRKEENFHFPVFGTDEWFAQFSGSGGKPDDGGRNVF